MSPEGVKRIDFGIGDAFYNRGLRTAVGRKGQFTFTLPRLKACKQKRCERLLPP